MPKYEYDDSEWPIFRVAASVGVPTADEYRAHWERVLEHTFERREPFVLLLDSRYEERPDALRRQILADAMQRGMKDRPGKLRGVAVVLSSRLQQGVLTAVNWMVRPPYPMSVFSDLVKAKRWAAGLLPDGEYGLFPPTLRSSARPPYSRRE